MPSRSIDPWQYVSVLDRKPAHCGTGSPSRLDSEGSLHEARAKEIELRASVHLAFESLSWWFWPST
jgi:hypothetical protein